MTSLGAFVAVTDFDWYRRLSGRPDLDELNFWQPSPSSSFRALQPGGLFLFKLHSPRDFIVGGGLFAHFTVLPISLAWETFREKNGVGSFEEMQQRVGKYRRLALDGRSDPSVGCILLEQPFFLPERQWIPVPPDWKPNIVRGKGYDLASGFGLSLWHALQAARPVLELPLSEEEPRYGKPTLVRPRLGQGSFRALVTDLYSRRCAITRERTLPVLQAAHIRPFERQGPHEPGNGLLLRSDLHVLFDRGYLTVTPEFRVEVSRRIREEFENGRDYYALQGKLIDLPAQTSDRPSGVYLQWHAENVFRG